jgi:dipeptidyl-peptidase-4
MASYIWAPDSAHLLFDSNGRLWLYDLAGGKGVEIGASGMGFRRRSAVFTQRRVRLVFARPRAYVARVKNLAAWRLLVAAAPNAVTLNGEVDWVYEEELDVRSNYFWSPDSTRLAYLQMDETAVPEYPITDWIPTHATVDMQRYPQPGDRQSEGPRGRGQCGGRRDGLGRACRFVRGRITFRASGGWTRRRCGLRQ